jgi:hypothetical protein
MVVPAEMKFPRVIIDTVGELGKALQVRGAQFSPTTQSNNSTHWQTASRSLDGSTGDRTNLRFDLRSCFKAKTVASPSFPSRARVPS